MILLRESEGEWSQWTESQNYQESQNSWRNLKLSESKSLVRKNSEWGLPILQTIDAGNVPILEYVDQSAKAQNGILWTPDAVREKRDVETNKFVKLVKNGWESKKIEMPSD